MAGASTGEAAARWASLIAARRLFRRLLRCVCSCLGRVLDCFDVFIRVIGPVFIVLALSLFGFVSFTFFTLVLPGEIEDGASPLALLTKTIVGMFLLANLVFNYLMAICVSPGNPPVHTGDKQSPEDGAEEELGQPPPVRQCTKCFRQKPPRTHHCSVCKRCVLKMDHHCPWINNCVGYHNYRYFCLFLLYLAAACLFVVVTMLKSFVDATFHPRLSRQTFLVRQCVSLSWIVAVCIFFALCLLGGFHVYLVLTNQTTIEFHSNMGNKDKARKRGEYYRNPYDLGRTRNFQQVFGPNEVCHFLWLLPCVARRPAGDGMSFSSLSELRA